MSEYDNTTTPPPAPATPNDDRTMAMLTHLSAILLGFIIPLVVWLINKDKPEKAFLTDQAKESLNFNITLLFAYIALFILTIVTLGLASPLSLLLWVVSIVFFVLAGVAANKGVAYRYPFALRLIK